MVDAFSFLPPGGTTGSEIRGRDWSETSLGPPEDWPPALRNALSLMLSCPTAMFLAWGPDLLCFYNDAYRPILGYRLDTALGHPFREVWASIWNDIGWRSGRKRSGVDVVSRYARRPVEADNTIRVVGGHVRIGHWRCVSVETALDIEVAPDRYVPRGLRHRRLRRDEAYA